MPAIPVMSWPLMAALLGIGWIVVVLLGGAATVLGSLLLPQPARAVTLSAASSATAGRVVRRWV